MKVKMLATAASPEKVLRAGMVYNLPPDEAERFCKGEATYTKDGKVIVMPGIGPYAVPAPDAKKVERIPPQPDPEDIPVDDMVEDDE